MGGVATIKSQKSRIQAAADVSSGGRSISEDFGRRAIDVE